MYKKLFASVSVVLALTGCTVEPVIEKDNNLPATAETQAATSPPETYVWSQDAKELAVINFVIEYYGSMPNSKEEILETAYLVCDSLYGGATLAELEQMIFEASTTQGDIDYLSAITAAAVGFLCPEYMPDDV